MRNVAVIAAILFVLGPGCTDSTKQSGSNYETVTADPHRDHEAAQRYHREALRLLDSGQVAEAEKALKRSLEADVRFGPAHNNLGQIYFEQGKLYLAAWEFQYAASLMPKQAEPLNNLGLVLEKGGQIDEAVDRYT